METVEFLKAIRLFDELPDSSLEMLASKTLELTFAKGRDICRENDRGDALFIIKSGIVEIFVGEGPEKKVFTYLKRGDYFGEMAIFTGDPRSASARAIADVQILGLAKAEFEALVRANPDLALELLANLSRRLAKANDRGGPAEIKGRLLFHSQSEKGAGKSVVARDLAAALAEMSGSRVCLVDPNVLNPGLSRSVGVDEECDLARELLATEAVTVDRYVTEVPGGFWALRPQRMDGTTYPLRESHHHILMNALVDRFDYVVVDSSSTMAQFNRKMMQQADRLIVVLSGKQESIPSFLRPFETLVLGQGGVDRRKVLYLFNSCGGEVSDPGARVGDSGPELAQVLPYDPETLKAAEDARTTARQVRPDSAWVRAIERLAREVYRSHRLEVVLPQGADAARAEAEASRLGERLTAVFSDPAEVNSVAVWDESDPTAGPGFRVRVRSTDEHFTRGMDEFLQLASAARERLEVPQVLIRVDGRPSLI